MWIRDPKSGPILNIPLEHEWSNFDHPPQRNTPLLLYIEIGSEVSNLETSVYRHVLFLGTPLILMVVFGLTPMSVDDEENFFCKGTYLLPNGN